MQKFAILTFLAVILLSFFLPSCKHDALPTPDPDPIDSTDIDTTDIDTTDMNTGVPCSPDTVYFQNQVLPLLVSHCAKPGCHSAEDKQDGVILTSYQNLMTTVDDVGEQDWSKNELMEVLLLNDPDERMPPAPNLKLTFDEVNLISKWIAQGARNNSCNENFSGCSTTNVKFSTDIRPVLQTKCVGCHSGSLAFGNVLLADHAGAKAVATNGKLVAAITRTSNWMPKNGAKLDDCTVDKIKAWVAAGALDN